MNVGLLRTSVWQNERDVAIGEERHDAEVVAGARAAGDVVAELMTSRPRTILMKGSVERLGG